MKIEKFIVDGEEIAIPRPESYKDCFTLIKSDRYRVSGKIDSVFKILISSLNPFKNKTLFWYRLSLHKGILYPLCRFMYKCVCLKNHVFMTKDVRVGYGFYIGQGVCIYINPRTVIGNNVNISQFLNIGTNSEAGAIVGDNVYIGPMTCVVENPVIGNNVSIGAGAIVSRDIPTNATAVGVPAKVINYNNPARYILNKWPINNK